MTQEKLAEIVADIAARKMAVIIGQFATLGKKPNIFLHTNLIEKPVHNVHANLLYDEADDRLVFSIPVMFDEVRYFEQRDIKTDQQFLRTMRDTLLN